MASLLSLWEEDLGPLSSCREKTPRGREAWLVALLVAWAKQPPEALQVWASAELAPAMKAAGGSWVGLEAGGSPALAEEEGQQRQEDAVGFLRQSAGWA